MSEVISSNATLDDIIFKDKNKAYGAYLLRSTYPRVITRSVLLGAFLFTGALALAFFWKQLTAFSKEKTEVTAEVMKIDQPPPQKQKVELPPPPPPPPPKEIPKVTTTKFLPPEIKHDEEVTKPEPPPEEVKGNTANETVKGETETYEPPVDPDAKGKEEAPVEPPKPVEEEIFTAVEQQAEFPGGNAAFGKFLSKNLKYPSAAQRANVSGRVYVQFVVNTDGSIQDVQVLKSVGFGCDEEAVRVIKTVPKWTPGKQSGRPVRSRFTVPINFVLSE
ncbi:outer membrane transport energization protein TonB [Pseudarcicella hirudinis]|uniref:Outer membrane transport energization protein TonB n=1 Tax=Pseudarcicella hirudinis TaxID=1079859 RepID=A0A1I5XP55_9BACT|nr:energy transducer TonB [Pseudarcicella hirudinis]SFQ33497.1 outer membrane transport energization protein TonB [Pseudarcicella hirudinis]